MIDTAATPRAPLGERIGARYWAWIAVAVGVGLAVEVPAFFSATPPGDGAAAAAQRVMVAFYLAVVALGFADAQSRRHGRSLAVTGAALWLTVLAVPRLLDLPAAAATLPVGGPQTPAMLQIAMSLAAPALLAAAFFHRGRPLRRPGRALAITAAIAVVGAVALTGLAVALAAALPAPAITSASSLFNHTVAVLVFVPALVALVLVVRGARGDPWLAPSIAAALVLLFFQELATPLLGGRASALSFVQNLLLVTPAPLLMIGQLGLYRASVRAERQAAMEAAFLYDAAKELTVSVDAEAILEQVVAFATLAIATNSRRHDIRASIFTIHEGWATMVAQNDLTGSAFVSVAFPLCDHEFLARAVTHRATVIGTIGSASLLGQRPAESIRTAHLKHGVYAPVLRADTVIGVLVLAGRLDRPFRAAEVRIVEGLATVASLALTNAANFRELEHQREVLATSEERLRAIVDSAFDAVITMDGTGAITRWSSRAESIFGWSPAEAEGSDLADLIIPEHLRAAHRAGLARFAASGQGTVVGTVVEVDAVRRGGEVFPVEIAISEPLRGTAGVTFVGFLREVSERHRAAAIRELRYSVAREFSTATSLDDVMPRLFTLAGDAFGWEFGQLWTAQPTDEASGALRPSHRWAVDGLDASAVAAESDALDVRRGVGTIGLAWSTVEPILITDVVTHPDFVRRRSATTAGLHAGLAVPVVSDAATIGVLEFLSRDSGAAQPGIVEVLVDVARQLGQFMARRRAEDALRESAARLADIAATDPLTGLKNRREFVRVLATAPRQPFSVLAIDVDGLKPVNDEYGHEAGDMLLQAVAITLSSLARGWDVVARIGGDEFAVVLPGARAEEAALVSERMRLAMHATTAPYGQPRVSVGWAAAPAGGDATATWRCADEQLYRAKRSGRDRVEGTEVGAADGAQPYGPRLSKDGETLASVLAASTISVVYQPIVRLSDRVVIAHEALARPEGALPDDDVSGLFAAARRLGRIRDLDWICRRAALRDAHRLGHHGVLFVNVSAMALLDPVHDVDQLLMLLRSVQRAPESLVLELTEQDPISDLARLRMVSRVYREHGMRFAVDDVGEGHSTLEVLAALNPEFIKIAGSLTTTTSRSGSRAAVEAALGFARSSGAMVIAEGVENELTAMRLAEMGVQAGQGFHLARPSVSGSGGARRRSRVRIRPWAPGDGVQQGTVGVGTQPGVSGDGTQPGTVSDGTQPETLPDSAEPASA